MNVLVLYLSITVIGYFIGAFLTRKGIALKGMSIMQTIAIIALVFLMGSRIGADRLIVKSLDSIGLAAFVMTLFILAGSVLAVFLARKLLGFDKKGDLKNFAGAEKGSGERFAGALDKASVATKNERFVSAAKGENSFGFYRADDENSSGSFAATNTGSPGVGDLFGIQDHECLGDASYHADSSDTPANPSSGDAPGCSVQANAPVDSGSHGVSGRTVQADVSADSGISPAVASNENVAAPSPEADDSTGMDHTMTICIAVSVIAGILAGYFIIPEGFAEISGNLIVAGLSLLLLFVGMDIGVEGTIVANFKRAGWRVIVFPFVIMIGTYIGAAAASLVLPVTMKDALCVGSGFGWYTLAPAMLAEYSMEISAMSFMHNVMRELIGILLMPLVAAKVGYIETISLPGSSSMDVCLPIVERVTKSDIAVYSFLSGAVLSASTPIMVSFMMGL